MAWNFLVVHTSQDTSHELIHSVTTYNFDTLAPVIVQNCIRCHHNSMFEEEAKFHNSSHLIPDEKDSIRPMLYIRSTKYAIPSLDLLLRPLFISFNDTCNVWYLNKSSAHVNYKTFISVSLGIQTVPLSI